MDLYTETSTEMTRLLTRKYSTSFASASRLFPRSMRPHIYNIYGFVRVADEIVDTYTGSSQTELLDALERDCYAAIERSFSANPIVHAFAWTARQVGIDKDVIAPFFVSMRMDTVPVKYTQALYEQYIYGSAEVIGLMCLRVFCIDTNADFRLLRPGAQKLGAAFQKVNFLRDVAEDYMQLGRFYFPGLTFARLNEQSKRAITADIRHDFSEALPYVRALPKQVRPAVMTSYRYYESLLSKLETTPVETVKRTRLRLPAHQKALLLASEILKART